MPELPEVEIIKRGLEKLIVGRVFNQVLVLSEKSFVGNHEVILGKKVVAVFRRAKNLGIELEGNLMLLVHLKMSGQLIVQRAQSERFIGGHPTQDMFGKLPNGHTRVIFEFNEETKLFFNDQRKFGWVKLVSSDPTTFSSLFEKLGPEPLEDGFNLSILKTNLLKHKKTPIKVAILDQTVVAGVGNIYACEALFNASVNPQIKVGELSETQLEKIFLGVIKALKMGIEFGGSTKTHFTDAEGRRGLFLDYAAVYNRDGKICLNCPEKICKIKLGGRGTFFCSNCQR